MAGKFANQSQQFSVGLGELFNRSIRQALLKGLEAALRGWGDKPGTVHDSSNAAMHWMIGARGKTRPGGRKYGKLRDLRGTNDRPSTPPVGKRRTYGAQEAAVYRAVRERELREVIDRLVVGRNPVVSFYFYHPAEVGSDYYKNAGIEEAGKTAVAATAKVYQDRIATGQTRKVPL